MTVGSKATTSSEPEFEPLSWRDPSGFVVRQGERIYRAVAREAVDDVQRLLESSWFRGWMERGAVPATTWIASAPRGYPDADRFRWLEHEKLQFPCYPHEITALQLHDAASLTLEIASDALANGWMLKDASAWNVLFAGGRPVFCDVLSFSPLQRSRIWPAYAQFQRHFVIPLLLYKRLGLRPSAMFLSHRDGVKPAEARQMIRGFRAWTQPALEAVTLPSILASAGKSLVAKAASDRDSGQGRSSIGGEIIGQTLARLKRHINALQPKVGRSSSVWMNYEERRDHYTEADLERKREYVHQALSDPAIRTVLDLGCNAGEFSLIASSLQKQVVAADSDEESLARLYSQLRTRHATIQPVLLDLGRPTPAVGWMNSETASFMERAAGRFDCILMLGLLHHLLVSERASLRNIAELLLLLAPRIIVVEWIEPSDRRFKELTGTNHELYATLSSASFEQTFSEYFTMESRSPLPNGTRVMYVFSRAD